MKSLILSSFLLCILSLSYVAVNAQDAGQVDPTPVPAAQVQITKATNAVNTASSKIPDSLPATAAVLIGVVSEVAMRVFPTARPKSWFLVIALFLAAVGTFFTKLGSILNNVNDSIKEPPKAP